MTLESLRRANLLRRHETSRREVADLLGLAERGLADARVTSISLDLRFTAAYNAALSLATIPLACSGYRTRGAGHHHTTFGSLRHTLGPEAEQTAEYLDLCRTKRNIVEYTRAGAVSESEIAELIAAVEDLRQWVGDWLASHSPHLTP